jgi:hypothetical protein
MQQQCQGVRRGDLVVRIIWHGGLLWDDAQSLVHLIAGSNGAGSRIGLPDVLAEYDLGRQRPEGCTHRLCLPAVLVCGARAG